MTAQHTPLPWEYDGNVVGMIKKDGALVALVYGCPAGEDREDLAEMRANIDLILRAVNSHADLVKALTMSLPLVERAYILGGDPTREGALKALEAIRTALSKGAA